MDQLPAYYFDYLRQGLWHCTSLEGLRAIHQSGEIRGSSADLTARYTNSYAHHRHAVSLFCFDRASEEQALEFAFEADDSMLRSRPVPVFIGVDREAMDEHLVENHYFDPEFHKKGQYRSETLKFLWVPYIEAWCLRPIPLNAVTGYVVTSFADEGMFRFVPAGPDALDEIVQIAAEFDV